MPTTAVEQGALTIIVEIKPNEVDALDQLLAVISDKVDKKGCLIEFGRLTTVHFMRWVLLPASPARIKELVEREDHLVQNQLTHLVAVKPGWFRLTTLRLVLALIDLLAHYYYVHGLLGDIPTIHFGRWVIIDGGKRLLFFSNYDGSWINYLGDFIDKAAAGLTAVWSNTVGCPKSSGLVSDGATDEQRFKSWTRGLQLITQVWYSAYEQLTVDNINNTHKLRTGLFGKLSEAEERDWLSLL